jgi:hypothetical protein
MKTFFLAVSLIAPASFSHAMEKPAPQEYTQKDIQHMFGCNKSDYLQKLGIAANLIALQDELASAIHTTKTIQEQLEVTDEEKLALLSSSNGGSAIDALKQNIFEEWKGKNITFITPDGIAFALEFINSCLFDQNRTKHLIANNKTSNNPEILKLIASDENLNDDEEIDI